MSLIDLPSAKAHLRLESSYPDAQVVPYLNAAELSAAEFLNRALFEDQASLDAAIASVPAALITAGVAYQDALTAADAIDDTVAQCAARSYACDVYRDAQTKALETRRGMVANDLIKAAILLILGHLFENRQDVQAGVSSVQIPMGSLHLLQSYRVGLGV